jgi:hypothetical protein
MLRQLDLTDHGRHALEGDRDAIAQRLAGSTPNGRGTQNASIFLTTLRDSLHKGDS